MTTVLSKLFVFAAVAMLAAMLAPVSVHAQNTNTTIQQGQVCINRTLQYGDSNANSTYQNCKVNINRTVQRGKKTENATAQFGRINRNHTRQGRGLKGGNREHRKSKRSKDDRGDDRNDDA